MALKRNKKYLDFSLKNNIKCLIIFIFDKKYIMEEFITWSGWVFGLVSTIIAVIQFRGKEKLKIEINKTRNSTENYSADNGGVSVRKNTGGIHLGKK